MAIDTHLKNELEEADRIYGGEEMYRLFGPTSLSYASTDSSRMYMFTSHIKQVLTLTNPDVARLQTGTERTIGKYNKAYKELEGEWSVEAKIPKFENGQIYTLVLYSREKDLYDMIEKPIAEDLPEKFGYLYNTERMDALEVGDVIQDEVIFKSTSYDEHMNYRYGKNANVCMSTSTDTIEDAISIRRSWAQGTTSVEVDTVETAVNENDIFLNFYGDDEVYRPIPDIGEPIKNSVICATRRLNKNHMLYDFQSQNMREAYSTDTEYYVPKNSILYDIDIYYNNDDPMPDTIFYRQIKGYYKDICAYADQLLDWCNRIKQSGSNYTDNISYFRSRYLHWNDPEYKWKRKDKAFGNMFIVFKVKSIVSLESGAKLSGRYGDKGVVSNIVEDINPDLEDAVLNLLKNVPDEERERLRQSINIVDDERMPYTDDCPVDILLNMSGSIRRLNPGQLSEIEVNFIARQVQLYILNQCKNREEKIAMIFQLLEIVSKDEFAFFSELFHAGDTTLTVDGCTLRLFSKEKQDAFLHDVEENGFYFVRPPHKPICYDTIVELYEAFPFVKPVPMYVNLFGIKKRRIMRDGVVGSKYIIILKHNSNKNFSARSTFRINRSDLPAKDITKKTNRASYAKTPVRLSEIYNLLASVSGRTMAEYNIFMRSAALGRKSLDRIIAADGNPMEIKKLKVKANYINANADILNARLKGIGLRLRFSTEKEDREDLYENVISPIYIDGYTIYDYPTQKATYQVLFQKYKEVLGSALMLESYPGEKRDWAWDQVFELEEVKAFHISDETKELLRSTTKNGLRAFQEARAGGGVEYGDELSPPAPKKRGRKPKPRPE